MGVKFESLMAKVYNTPSGDARSDGPTSIFTKPGLLSGVYHGQTGLRTWKEWSRSYLTIRKDLTRTMNRLQALYRSGSIPCAGPSV